MANDTVSKCWFLVLNNPNENGFIGTPQEICDSVRDSWIKDTATRAIAVRYCISAKGLHHLHIVLEDTKSFRFSAVKKLFPTAHIEPTKGNKKDALDYINKVGKFEEKGEQVVCGSDFGEITAYQGKAKVQDIIADLIESGCNCDTILDKVGFVAYRYKNDIMSACRDKRAKDIGEMRDVKCYFHIGASGSGKTYSCINNLGAKYGKDEVHIVRDFRNGFLDTYCCQKVLILDDLKGYNDLSYQQFLAFSDNYTCETHGRYNNVRMLWQELHVTSVFPPEVLYKNMVHENRDTDSIKQLYRRFDFIVYHWHDSITGKYESFEMPMSEYKGYDDLKSHAPNEGFEPFDDSTMS